MYTLVVVDMQPGFESANCPKTIRNVQREVERAKRNWASIIILEYFRRFEKDEKESYFGNTHAEITDLIKDYKWKHHVKKDEDGGGYHILEQLKDQEYEQHHFVLCGVNTTACVYWTTTELRTIFPQSKIELQLNACNQPRRFDTYWTRSKLQCLTASGVILQGNKKVRCS